MYGGNVIHLQLHPLGLGPRLSLSVVLRGVRKLGIKKTSDVFDLRLAVQNKVCVMCALSWYTKERKSRHFHGQQPLET